MAYLFVRGLRSSLVTCTFRVHGMAVTSSLLTTPPLPRARGSSTNRRQQRSANEPLSNQSSSSDPLHNIHDAFHVGCSRLGNCRLLTQRRLAAMTTALRSTSAGRIAIGSGWLTSSWLLSYFPCGWRCQTRDDRSVLAVEVQCLQ